MRSFQQALPEFDARGVRVAAISVDPPQTSRDLARSQGYTFTMLSDPQGETIHRYGVAHEKAGPEGEDIARPAEFLIDAAGTVRWVNFSGSITSRLRPAETLAAVDGALGPR